MHGQRSKAAPRRSSDGLGMRNGAAISWHFPVGREDVRPAVSRRKPCRCIADGSL
jgi:hypothetical protein